ncbi:MAG: hypothetical protein V8T45_12005 [Oscillospiraceae bacterium]
MKYTYDFMNDDQKALVDLVHEVLTAKLDPQVAELDQKGEFPWTFTMSWARLDSGQWTCLQSMADSVWTA